MPRVKFDYVVSFSSEDPEHPASNLLNHEVSKKKWLCKKGESSCSVVLQLPRAVKISAVHIGAYHAALVEVLVARSETASEQFQVLVPSSVFLSREESRRDAAVQRVRSYSAAQLAEPARDQRWDRLRLVCSQPYNKHCKYGLSFVHIDEFACSAAPRLQCALPLGALDALDALDALASSDEDDFKPGELFAQHLLNKDANTKDSSASNTTNTGAQIRQATSLALKNIPESCTNLTKTPISKPSVRRDNSPPTERSDRRGDNSPPTERSDRRGDNSPPTERSDRSRDTLLYTRDDERPHDRIDAVLQRHKDHKELEEKHTSKPEKRDNTNKLNDTNQKVKDEPKNTPKMTRSDTLPKNDTPQKRTNRNYDKPASDHKKNNEVRKRRRSDSPEKPGPVHPEPHTILSDVVLVLSGYENPRRAQLRNTALALGAQVMRDWGPTCTHLICAFPNTPKLRAARAAAGAGLPAARGDWLDECSRLRRRLPWAWYATEPKYGVQPRPELLDDTSPPHEDPRSEGDTDDEIEKVLQEQKRRLTDCSNTKQTRDDSVGGRNTDDTRTETKARDSEDDVITDEERDVAPAVAQYGGALPHFLDGYTFAIDAEPDDAARLARYVQAYGGLVLQASDVERGSRVDYVVRGRGWAGRGGRAVGGAWLARCVAARALLPHDT